MAAPDAKASPSNKEIQPTTEIGAVAAAGGSSEVASGLVTKEAPAPAASNNEMTTIKAIPTYETSETSEKYILAKSLLSSGDFEQSLEVIEEAIQETRQILGSLGLEDSDLHESMAPFHYLYGTTLLYSIEESNDTQMTVAQTDEDVVVDAEAPREEDPDTDNNEEAPNNHPSSIDDSNGEDDDDNNNNNNNNNMSRPTENMDDPMALLLRHSSPIIRDMPSPLTERTSSPSQLRPRSNPRNRTPMRYTSPLHGTWIPEERPVGGITIRPTAGRAVGTVLAAGTAFRPTAQAIAEGRRTLGTKSRKQGPSHRKVRRWNNDNFVNLAAEINSGNKGGRAAQALLVGQAHAEQFRSICDPQEHQSKAMTRLREDDTLRDVRDKFFEGELMGDVKSVPINPGVKQVEVTTPEQMLLRIEARLRRVVIKACENSVPASSVVSHVEAFLLRAHRGKKINDEMDWWKDLLMEPPSITHRQRDDTYITRYLFAGDSPNGGFHRLLLHGLCQFHGLKASSSTMEVAVDETKPPIQARVLVATGTISEATKKVKMVDFIMLRKQQNEGDSGVDQLVQNWGEVTSGTALQKLKV